ENVKELNEPEQALGIDYRGRHGLSVDRTRGARSSCISIGSGAFYGRWARRSRSGETTPPPMDAGGLALSAGAREPLAQHAPGRIVEDRIAPTVAPNQEERHRIHSGLPRRECPFQQFASRPALTDCQAHHRRQPGGDVLSA